MFDVQRTIVRRRRVGQLFVIDVSMRRQDEDRTCLDVVLPLTAIESTIMDFARRKNEERDRTDGVDTDVEDLDEISGEQRELRLISLG